MTPPTPEDVVSTFVPIFSGFLSIVGATAILYNILSDHQRRFTSPYFRIMFGLSVADLIFGLVSMTSTFLDPKGNPWLYFARGNHVSCVVVGSIKHVAAFVQPIYIASLSIYYLFVIRFDMKDVVFRKKFEPWLHVIAYGYPLLGSIVCLSLGLFHSTPLGCRISAYPFGCDMRDKRTCTRGANAYIYRWVFSISVIIVSLSLVVCCMVSIVLYVRKRERIMSRRFSFANSEISRSRGLVKQYKAVTAQAILYIGSFLVVWTFPFVSSLSKKKPAAIGVLVYLLWPLQGFFNCLIYFWPRFVKTREEHGDKSCCWIFKDMIFTTTLVKEQRRVVSHAVRRRNSLRVVTSLPSSSQNSPQEISSLALYQRRTVDFVHPIYAISESTEDPALIVPTLTSQALHNPTQCGGPSRQVSSIDYEPLFRLRHATEEAYLSEDNKDSVTVIPAILTIDDSIGSTQSDAERWTVANSSIDYEPLVRLRHATEDANLTEENHDSVTVIPAVLTIDDSTETTQPSM